MPLGNPHITPKGCSLHSRLSAFQTGLSVQSSSTTWRTSRIIFNWRKKASHHWRRWELGLAEKRKTRNNFGLNHKRTKYCAYVFSWISSKFILLPGISLSPSPPLAKFLGIPSSRLPDISASPQLSRRSFHRSIAFQRYGIPQCLFEQLENVQLCTICSGSSYQVFSPSRCLLCRVRAEAVAEMSAQRVRAQFLPLNPLCSPLSKQNCCSRSEFQKWKLEERFPSFQFFL